MLAYSKGDVLDISMGEHTEGTQVGVWSLLKMCNFLAARKLHITSTLQESYKLESLAAFYSALIFKINSVRS